MGALLAQAKAIVGLVSVIVGALVVSVPDSALLKVVAGVVTAVAGYLAVYQVPNTPQYDSKHSA